MWINRSKNLLIFALVAAGLVAGFAREITLAYLFGTSLDIEVFRVAYGLPAILSDSLAVSFISVLIPYLIASDDSQKGSDRGTVIWSCLILTTLISVFGVLTMPMQARILAPGITGDARTTLILAGQICWIVFFLTNNTLPLRAMMSVKGKLWPAASAQFVKAFSLSVSLIALVIFLGYKNVYLPVFAAVFASCILLALHLFAIGSATLKSIVSSLRKIPDLAASRPIIGALFILFLTQIMMSGGRLLDRSFATKMDAGTLASLEYSYSLLMAMASLIAATTNIIMAPKIGRAFKKNGFIPSEYFRVILGIVFVAAIIGLIASPLATFVVETVFHYGAFDTKSVSATAEVFQVHALALGPIVLVVILNQLFLLQKRQRYLLVICFIKFTFRLVIILFLLRFFHDVRALTYGLLVSETTIAIIQILALFHIRRRQKQPI